MSESMRWPVHVKAGIKHLLSHADIAVTRHSTLETLRERSRQLDANSRALQDFQFLSKMSVKHVGRLFALIGQSRSQIRQDLFVLSQLDYKRGGFFVEFGATNGVDLSNTHLLEKEFGWQGVLAEPARCWHSQLMENRTCRIETSCVWASSGETISFSETNNPDLSTAQQFVDADHHSASRAGAKTYPVSTISLSDLLEKHHAPAEIDYLSIDTEGSEYEILRPFSFDKYRFRVVTCEHNYSAMRPKLHELLTGKGYRRVLQDVSQFDDWYLGPGVADADSTLD